MWNDFTHVFNMLRHNIVSACATHLEKGGRVLLMLSVTHARSITYTSDHASSRDFARVIHVF